MRPTMLRQCLLSNSSPRVHDCRGFGSRLDCEKIKGREKNITKKEIHFTRFSNDTDGSANDRCSIQRSAMRWVKLAALLSLWAGFFVCIALVHLWISVLGLPNRWKIISCLQHGFTFLIRIILNIKL